MLCQSWRIGHAVERIGAQSRLVHCTLLRKNPIGYTHHEHAGVAITCTRHRCVLQQAAAEEAKQAKAAAQQQAAVQHAMAAQEQAAAQERAAAQEQIATAQDRAEAAQQGIAAAGQAISSIGQQVPAMLDEDRIGGMHSKAHSSAATAPAHFLPPSTDQARGVSASDGMQQALGQEIYVQDHQVRGHCRASS